jgi:hypothetical protein
MQGRHLACQGEELPTPVFDAGRLEAALTGRQDACPTLVIFACELEGPGDTRRRRGKQTNKEINN